MRISNGPSCRKLKPRWASSNCGDETPTSISAPVIAPAIDLSPQLRYPAQRSALGKPATAVLSNAQFFSHSNGLGIAIKCNHPPVLSEFFEHRATVPATTERRVNKYTILGFIDKPCIVSNSKTGRCSCTVTLSAWRPPVAAPALSFTRRAL